MTSKIKVDNINKVSDDSNIIKKCGTTTTVGSGSGQTIVIDGATVTLGRCGGSVALASGASQTGFGRTGTVNWNTTKITADPNTAASGVGYFTDTSSSAFNVTLPASPSAGDIVAVADYANNWNTNAVTILRNGKNIEGAASDLICNTKGSSVTLVYVDTTKGWIVVNSGNSDQAADIRYVTATGGTITTSGDDKIHTFTGPGTFTISCVGNPAGSTTYSYHVIAGGGGAGRGYGSHGGAGGFRSGGCFGPSPLRVSAVTAVATDFPITVGAGGAGQPPSPYGPGSDGSNSSGFSKTAAGGGGGAGAVAGPSHGANGRPGGSGGGATGGAPGSSSFTGGSGNTPPVSPPQGNNGAPSALGNPYPGYNAQGGGAGAAGGHAGAAPVSPTNPTGVPSTIGGSDIEYSAGGPNPGTANTGHGGNSEGGNAQSGVVIIRYKYQN